MPTNAMLKSIMAAHEAEHHKTDDGAGVFGDVPDEPMDGLPSVGIAWKPCDPNLVMSATDGALHFRRTKFSEHDVAFGQPLTERRHVRVARERRAAPSPQAHAELIAAHLSLGGHAPIELRPAAGAGAYAHEHAMVDDDEAQQRWIVVPICVAFHEGTLGIFIDGGKSCLCLTEGQGLM